ncbi:hypothetical protein KA005_42330, partial [bacterium]|nr:hypothetical protein [bacterium]
MNQLVRLALMKDFWDEAVKGQAEYIIKATTNYGMYEGGDKQWDAADIAYLDSKKRHHLSLNIILPIINLLTGYERQNRMDIKCFPKKGGIKMVADLMTELAKHIEDQSLGLYLRSAAFLDGIVSIKGFLSLDIKYDEDPFNGEIVTDTD